jgi:16S rRNA (cytosine967-C5)-methyltransferase
MSHPLHLKQSAELLQLILGGTLPADRQMESYFRSHREMGVRDRGQVAGTVYGCLRHKRLLEHLSGSDAPRILVAAHLLREGLSARALEEAGFKDDARALVGKVRTLDPQSLPFAVRHSFPDWLADRLVAQFGEQEAGDLAQTLNRPAPLDLRVNSLKGTREEVAARLATEGIACEPTPFSPTGLRLREHAALVRTGAFKEGLFEVQDEGSQLLSVLLEPRRHEMIVDFCAGAGGKTLHLAALTANTGTVYAFDVSAARLERLKPRVRRAGAHNVRAVAIRHERDERVLRLTGKVDRVLVDSPCSGIGTLRRNPDIKWRPLDLAALTAQQSRILAAAATLVKGGGRVVYATCSLLREENDDIVREFLAAHPDFRIVPVNEILARRHVPLTMADEKLRLLPHRHDTDGFYACALERNA